MVKESDDLDLGVKAEGSEVQITSKIINEKAGHKLPTGADSFLPLQVSATDNKGNVLFENQTKFFKASAMRMEISCCQISHADTVGYKNSAERHICE